jgi:hypothetical protein
MTAASRLLCGLVVAAAAQDQPPVKFGTTVVISSGLEGHVYHIRRNSTKLPDFTKLKSVGRIWTTSLNVPPQDFHQGFPGVTNRFEWFALDYAGRFWIEQPGLYSFAVTSDDGAKLYIDGQLVVDNDGIHDTREKTGDVGLSGGIHEIRVSYFQGPRFLVALVVKVAPPGEPLRVFSTDEFKPPPDLAH